MKVGRLIEFLRECNPDAELLVSFNDEWDHVSDFYESALGVWIVVGDLEEMEEMNNEN